jgi:hypothetical protein
MPRFTIGDVVSVQGRRGKVIWLSENASEIEAIDEYIVEFDDHDREFVISAGLEGEQPPSIGDREQNSDRCYEQT